MKKFFLFLLLLTTIIIASAFFYALPKAEQYTLNHIANLGYKNATIENTSITFSGFVIDKINLDKDGFSYVENVSIKLFWPSFLIKRDIDLITINKITMASVTDDLRSTFFYKNNFNTAKIASISAKKIDIKNIIWDTATPQGAIRIEAQSTIEKTKDKSLIKASVHAAQHELSFNSNWSGYFDDQNNIELEGTLDQLNVNYAPLHLHRGTGWLSYHQLEEETSLSGQLDSGSGKIFNIPINNISLTIGKKDNYYPILFRTQASGIKNVYFTSDLHYSKKTQNKTFDTTLKISDFSAFINYLKKLEIIKTDLKTGNNKQTNIALTYMSEKRFADGPLPFDLTIEQTSSDVLNGTFLLYTDSMDIRGTAQGDEDFLGILKTLFLINDKNISGDVLRIDGNLKSLITHSN